MDPSKLHPSLAASLGSAKAQGEPIPLIVKVRPGPIARGEARALTTTTPRWNYRLVSARAIRVRPSEIDALTHDPSVELLWPDLPVHTWLETAVPFVRAPKVWDSGFTGEGIKIAIIDTGLDYEHPDFDGRLMSYRDFVDPEGPDCPCDPNGHGTHVASIAAGSGAASEGQYMGVAPGARLVIARALNAAGGGRTSQVMAAVEWAVDQGAQVVNVSLGGAPFPCDGTDALSMLCDAAVREGVVVCVAAGNLGPAGKTIGSPAAAAEVITVGAAELIDGGASAAVAEFSSRGPTADGRVKPDLLFPGASVIAARAQGTNLGTPSGVSYTAVSGTSQATPIASGTAALLLQANPRLRPSELKSRLVRGARLLPRADDCAQGAGLGDSYNTFVSAKGVPLGKGDPSDGDGRRPVVDGAGCLTALASWLPGAWRCRP